MIVIGIDNGKAGAIVGLTDSREVCFRLPNIGDLQEIDIARALQELSGVSDPPHAFIERAQWRASQGASAGFNYGVGHGFLRGCLVALGIPYERVNPPKWQKEMFAGIRVDEDKKVMSRDAATHLQPNIDWRANERCRTAHDGLTDAYLIAEWGRRQLVKRGVIK